MKNNVLLLLLLLSSTVTSYGQSCAQLADSIRQALHLPALGYAVVTADSIPDIRMLGVRKAGDPAPATLSDRFRIGSNTKAITGMLAAMQVKAGHLRWDTEFFSLFPELKSHSHPAYHHLTLLQTLTFRTRLIPYTYTNNAPTPAQIPGTPAMQRYHFAAWLLQQPPVAATADINLTNSGYPLASLMLEKASGHTYPELLAALGQQLQLHFGVGSPNYPDSTQTWGHDAHGIPEPPADHYKLNWLMAAGNINISLEDYACFIQLQLKGLAGRSDLLTAKEFAFLHTGLPHFAVGWFWEHNDAHHRVSYNKGNPGTFLTTVRVIPTANRGYIIFTNQQRDDIAAALDTLQRALEKQYGY
ncbi:serine hydrolase domain-containing protein [Chitinophaga nivalis]|uniref:Beta-lactamase family protein n=1 Tax=Chitinophaga nivalis TaxID=2991709 RepID=A0ABT3IHV2_9BACT|nr:serine hydrolase domain-containing protein [Chitinophaga nivalis]MCW3466773.1 beta-lactamase family protein [Chitinophaga nivalis]MCW3483536.1 beta-lactamase family protein [Chitinophaga nivalis]